MLDESLHAFLQKKRTRCKHTEELDSCHHFGDFVASFPNGEPTIYEVIGLSGIEDPVTDLNVFVAFQQLRVRFKK